MKVFIWEYLHHVSDSYHSEGGLVVTAATLERARELAVEAGVSFEKDEDPTITYDIAGDAGEDVFVFPDAGCC